MLTRKLKFISVRVLGGKISSNPNPNQKLQNARVMVSMFYCVRTKRDEFISKLCLCFTKRA